MARKRNNEILPPVAQRLRLVMHAHGFFKDNLFAQAIEESPSNLGNMLRSGSISKAVLAKLVNRFPGLTTDWLLYERWDTLTVQMANLLRQTHQARREG